MIRRGGSAKRRGGGRPSSGGGEGIRTPDPLRASRRNPVSERVPMSAGEGIHACIVSQRLLISPPVGTKMGTVNHAHSVLGPRVN